jgi:ubiquinone/menaquinone biosynthesis C-methylase UbiE
VSKSAEKDYVSKLPPEGKRYLQTRPFGLSPNEDALLVRQFSDLLHLLDLPAGSLVLDAGTGPGWVALTLGQAGYRVVGVDISASMLSIAHDRAGSQEATAIGWAVCDMESMSIRGSLFDGVVMYGALHHVEDEALCIRECYRVLRPGGRLVISEPNWLHQFSQTARKEQMCCGVVDKGLTPRHVKRLLRQAGFAGMRRYFPTSKPYGSSLRDLLRHIFLPVLQRALLGHFATHVLLVAVKPDE